jgi:3-oxoacyl-(acyl-carrier-protein) synthase
MTLHCLDTWDYYQYTPLALKDQFMSGSVSGALNRVLSVSEFHRDLAEGPLELSVPEWGERQEPAPGLRPRSRGDRERVAVTGKVGAFQNISVSREELGIPPQDFRSMADSTKLTLWLAEEAIKQSGILESGLPRERIGVLISQNSGEGAATITDLVFDVHYHDIIRSLRDLLPMTEDLEKTIKQRLQAGRLTVDDTTLLGRLSCAAGGFVCNRHGLRGPSYPVSAACATSLVALFNAIQMIRNDIIDAAVVGGGEEFLHPSHYIEFSALKALAGLSGVERPAHETSRPFDAQRDGMVLGEGGGMIVVERESVAKKRGVPLSGKRAFSSRYWRIDPFLPGSGQRAGAGFLWHWLSCD